MTAKFKTNLEPWEDKTKTDDDFISNIKAITAPLGLDSNNNLRER